MIAQLRLTLFALMVLAATSSFAQAPNISYAPQYMTVGFEIMQVKPSNSGGAVTSRYTVSPALPGGLIINGTTGIITGTPTVASPATNYTVTTSNADGSNLAIINITVSPTPSYISYTTPQVFTTGAAITPLTPVNNTGGSFDGTFYTNPALPAGLTIDTLSGVISGTPTVAGPSTIYTVYYAFSGPGLPGDPDDNPPVSQNSPDSTKITITINQGVASNNASLSNFQVSNGRLSPVFATGTYNYTINVGNGLKTMTVTPTAANASATIKVNGKTVTSGTPSGYLPLVVGANTVTTLVTAPDGSTTKTYTLTINEARSSNNNLAGLKISASTISPAFNLNTTSYTASVPYAISSITVTPTSADATATVTVNSKTVVSGSPSGAIELTEGTNTISTVVTAQNGAAKTYTITITRTAPSTNCNLSALAISKGALTPAFASATINYSDMVTNGTTSLTVTPTTQVTTSTVTVNGTKIASGSASGAIPLVVGSNTVSVVITAQDGTTKKTYTINVIRPSTNAKLDTLEIGTGPSTNPLKPAFNPNIVSYTTSVPYTQSEFLIYIAVAVYGATATVNGMEPSGPGVPADTSAENGNVVLPLNVGTNTISIVVTAPDGITTKTYTITVTREAQSTNDNLSALTINKGALSPAFAGGTLAYTDMVANGNSSVTVMPSAADPTSTITVNGTVVASGSASGAIPLAVGSNTISIMVTAQSDATQTYTVTVIRPSTNAKLSAFAISSGTLTPAFNANTTSYTASVANTAASITVTPTVAVTGATVKVNGTTVASGSPSGAIALSVGSNIITTVVTAQDGATTNTYTLTVTRPAGLSSPDVAVSVQAQANKPLFSDDILIIHQGVSPNGDGVNDFLVIDGILAYPDNKLAIMSRSGQLIFETKGYDNATKVFDGHSNKTGQMQLPGTYFYQLDYTVNGITKHKTGFLVLKY